MADFEFVIPIKRDDLQVSVEGQYFVAEVISHEDIPEKIQDCSADLMNDGCPFVLKHFDLLYSVIVEFNELDWNNIHKIYDKIIFKSISLLSKYIEEGLKEDVNDPETRRVALNVIKMTLYVYSQFFQCYMQRISIKGESATTVNVNVKGRKKKNICEQHTEEYSWDWEEKQRGGLIKIQTILQLHITNFWDPPVVEDTFVNSVADCCYKALEQPTIALVKSKYLKEIIIQILGLLIKQYNHGMSFVVKSVQLMKRFEHVASPLAEAVQKYITDFGVKTLVKYLIEEIFEASEMMSSASDNHSAKSFFIFLYELAEANPQEFEPALDSVLTFLESDLATLRSMGLSIVTEILLGCLSKDDADKEIQYKREKCLEVLNDHVLDINAHVRAKVMQLWQKIVACGALPKKWLIPLMDTITERMMDVSSVVTKQAVHLMRLIMETNPFAGKLSLSELTTTLEEETKIYKEMKKNKQNLRPVNRETMWAAVEPDLKMFLEEFFKEGSNLKAPPESPDLKKNRIKTICSFLSERNFNKAVNLLIHAEDTLSEYKELREGIAMSNIDLYLGLFKSIFFDSQNIMSATGNSDSHLSDSFTASGTPEPKQEQDETNNDLFAQKSRVKFYSDCVEFVKVLNVATDNVFKLLSSKQLSDVVEAVEFVKVAKQFNIYGSDMAVIEMMKLLNCPEENIKTCALKAFEQLYLYSENQATSPTESGYQIVKNLSTVVKTMNLSQKDSLNILIKEWVKNSSINSYCIAAMISVFSMEQPTFSADDSLCALVLFSNVVHSQPKLVNDFMDVLIQKGIMRGRKRAKDKDLRIVRYVCEVLLYATSDHPSKRFPNDHQMFVQLSNCIFENFLDDNAINYLYMVESAINMWFKIAMDPDRFCKNLMSVLQKLINGNQSTTAKLSQSSITSSNSSVIRNDNEDSLMEQAITKEKQINQESLTRMIFIVGHIALRYCSYLEHDVLEEQKKRSHLKIKEKAQLKQNTASKDDADDELSMAVDILAANDDALAENIRSFCENEIVYGIGNIGSYAKLVINIIKNDQKYSNLRLRSIASVTLGQFMLVSRKFCSENIQLFVTILEKTPDTVIKNNLIVLFGELLFRHPNIIEPWITYLYSRLQDPCKDVRFNTLLVISHLITNEMVKVKAQISEVALCIVDAEENIKESATRLFYELSLKGNTLYNVLPDIISTLSNPDATNPLTEENFRKIFRYLIDLIQKEKQMELLIEKLCIRLRNSESERQWSDLCFCLSLFSYTDRSVRKLIDNFHSSFSTKLHCTAVYNCLTTIIATANRSTKPGIKESAAELSAMLDEAGKVDNDENAENSDEVENKDRTTSLGDEEGTKKVSKLKTPHTVRRGSKTASVRKTRTTAKKKKPVVMNSDSDSDVFQEEAPPSARPVRATRRKLVIENDSDDEDEN